MSAITYEELTDEQRQTVDSIGEVAGASPDNVIAAIHKVAIAATKIVGDDAKQGADVNLFIRWRRDCAPPANIDGYFDDYREALDYLGRMEGSDGLTVIRSGRYWRIVQKDGV